MTAEEKLAELEEYVREQMKMSRDIADYYSCKDTERRTKWLDRYDVLYGVLLKLIY